MLLQTHFFSASFNRSILRKPGPRVLNTPFSGVPTWVLLPPSPPQVSCFRINVLWSWSIWKCVPYLSSLCSEWKCQNGIYFKQMTPRQISGIPSKGAWCVSGCCCLSSFCADFSRFAFQIPLSASQFMIPSVNSSSPTEMWENQSQTLTFPSWNWLEFYFIGPGGNVLSPQSLPSV